MLQKKLQTKKVSQSKEFLQLRIVSKTDFGIIPTVSKINTIV